MGRVLAHQVGQLAEQAKFFCVLFASPFILDTWPHFFFFCCNLGSSLIPHPYHTTSTLGVGCNLGIFFPCFAPWVLQCPVPQSRMIRKWTSSCNIKIGAQQFQFLIMLVSLGYLKWCGISWGLLQAYSPLVQWSSVKYRIIPKPQEFESF